MWRLIRELTKDEIGIMIHAPETLWVPSELVPKVQMLFIPFTHSVVWRLGENFIALDTKDFIDEAIPELNDWASKLGVKAQ